MMPIKSHKYSRREERFFPEVVSEVEKERIKGRKRKIKTKQNKTKQAEQSYS